MILCLYLFAKCAKPEKLNCPRASLLDPDLLYFAYLKANMAIWCSWVKDSLQDKLVVIADRSAAAVLDKSQAIYHYGVSRDDRRQESSPRTMHENLKNLPKLGYIGLFEFWR